MCTDLFGPTVKANFVRDQNKDAQNFYMLASEVCETIMNHPPFAHPLFAVKVLNLVSNTFILKATNIVLPNGSLDPWHALGTYATNEENGFMPYLINGMLPDLNICLRSLVSVNFTILFDIAGTAHCADMYPVYDGEPAGLVNARIFIESHLVVGLMILKM